ncbi:MAG: hypothetical protein MJZ58_02755 [Paludibacteraceae bacterium]|nr:hypothetical protein [Paludibacteraceae bacterium]
MKKIIALICVLICVGTLAFAYPRGCFEGSSRYDRDRCAIAISGDELCFLSKDGSVLTRWTIIDDDGSMMTVKAATGVVQTVPYGVEDGTTYIIWHGSVYTAY